MTNSSHFWRHFKLHRHNYCILFEQLSNESTEPNIHPQDVQVSVTTPTISFEHYDDIKGKFGCHLERFENYLEVKNVTFSC